MPIFSLQDLEARKRAPLYQKKQEEEMRAVSEKAAEADIRAQEAEIKFKEAKVSTRPFTPHQPGWSRALMKGWGVGHPYVLESPIAPLFPMNPST